MKKKYFDINRIEKVLEKFMKQGHVPVSGFALGNRVCVLYEPVKEKRGIR